MKANVAAERLHKDLLTFRAATERRFDRVIGRLDKVDDTLDKIDGRLDQVDRSLRGRRTDMPKIVGDATREFLGGKRRGHV